MRLGIGVRRRAMAFALLAILVNLSSLTVARAQPEEVAHGHYSLARALYDGGRFDEAAGEFQAAYDAAPRPALLYNLYLAYRDGGHAAEAADALRRYVATLDDGPTKVQLVARLRALERVVADRAVHDAALVEAATGAEVSSGTAETTPPQQDVSAATENEADRGDTLPTAPSSSAPWAVVAAGGGLALAGAVVGGFALRAQNDLESQCPDRTACTPGTWRSTRNRGHRLAVSADVLWIGGAAVGVTGLLWVLLRRTSEEPVATAYCSGEGCVVRLQGRF